MISLYYQQMTAGIVIETATYKSDGILFPNEFYELSVKARHIVINEIA
jgi:hypothetical protein